ncbi:MAG: hypothetical protein IT165_36085 [Bryobacterales bacterium]|nr:hypothetical protein [Bryobacterales bacterium]
MKQAAFALCVWLAVAGGAYTQGKGKGKGHNKPEGRSPATVEFGFTAGDRRVLHDYFAPGRQGLPPGLAKRERLPPGLEKQLRRNGQLPPGLQKKIVALPPDLSGRLSPLCGECRRGVVGRLAIIWNSRSGLIIDTEVIAGL